MARYLTQASSTVRRVSGVAEFTRATRVVDDHVRGARDTRRARVGMTVAVTITVVITWARADYHRIENFPREPLQPI